jgi:hypothetical protein
MASMHVECEYQISVQKRRQIHGPSIAKARSARSPRVRSDHPLTHIQPVAALCVRRPPAPVTVALRLGV